MFHAEQYSGKSVRIVVPFTPGATSDVLARMLDANLSDIWGQSVVKRQATPTDIQPAPKREGCPVM